MSATTISEVGPFRGLAPFSEADQQHFFGRDAERSRIAHWLRHERPPVALITGEPASGKTSLLLAGLAPAAKAAGMLSVYVDVGDEWESSLRTALARQLGRPLAAHDDSENLCRQLVAAQQKPLMLMLDHLDQVAWLDSSQGQRLNKFLDALAGSHEPASDVHLVYALERRELHVLGRLTQPQQRIPQEARLDLSRLDERQTAMLIERTILASGAYMEAGLPNRIAEDLCASGPVLPAEIQIVCHAAVLQRRLTQSAYRRAGGAAVLATLYTERLAQRAGGWRARRALTVMCEQDNPRALLPVDDIARGAGMTLPAAQQTLDALAQVNLARRVPPRGGSRPRYGLLHPYLARAVGDLVAPVRRGRAKARMMVRSQVERRALLGPHQLFALWRYLGTAIAPEEQKTATRSATLWVASVSGLLLVLIGALLGVWIALRSSHYMSTAASATGPDRIVVRRGDPALAFAFGWSSKPYGDIELDTGFSLDAVSPEEARALAAGEIAASSFSESGAKAPWLREMATAFPAAQHGALLLLGGFRSEGSKLLVEAAQQPAQRADALRALVMLLGDAPATQDALLACMTDERLALRLMAVERAQTLGGEALARVIERAIGDADAQVRLAAISAIAANSGVKTLPLLESLLADPDQRVRHAARKQLTAAAAAHPLQVFDVADTLLARHDGGTAKASRLSTATAAALEQLRDSLLRQAPQALVGPLSARLEHKRDPAERLALLRTLLTLADHLDAKALAAIQALKDSPNAAIRAAAIAIRGRIGDPAQAMETLLQMAAATKPRDEAEQLRQAAAQGLGWVHAPDEEQRLHALKRLSFDPKPAVADAAVASLLRIGSAGTHEVTQRIDRGFVATAQAALHAICAVLPPNRRTASAVWTAVWGLNRSALRRQALECSTGVARVDPGLGLWLVQRAAADKNVDVRRAATIQVALALQEGHRRFESLARFFSQDRDDGVQLAMFRALVEHPPQDGNFLWPLLKRASTATQPELRVTVPQLLVHSGMDLETAAPLIEEMLGDSVSTVRRAALMAALSLRSDDKARHATSWQERQASFEATLITLLANDEGTGAVAATKLAARLGLLGALKRAAKHPQSAVRALAIREVARQATTSAALALLRTARQDRELTVRLAAIEALGAQSARLGKDVVPLLLAGLRSSDAAEREAACAALGQMRGDGVAVAVEPLQQLAHNRSESLRRMALRALGLLAQHAPEAAPLLVEGTLDPARDVREEALAGLARYLARITPASSLWTLLIQHPRNGLLRRLATAALARQARRQGPAWLERATAGLAETTPAPARIAAKLALALAHGKRAPEPMIAWLFGW